MQTSLQDLDIYGNSNGNGTGIEWFDEDALKQALTMWLTTKKGEYLYAPDAGGIIDRMIFKGMRSDTIGAFTFSLRNALNNEFFPSLIINKIDVQPDYVNRLLEIRVEYINPETRNVEEIFIYTKDVLSIEQQKFEDVPYDSENLKMFCIIKKVDMGNELLVYDNDKLVWRWGRYIFINFNPETDPYANDIFQICNS